MGDAQPQSGVSSVEGSVDGRYEGNSPVTPSSSANEDNPDDPPRVKSSKSKNADHPHDGQHHKSGHKKKKGGKKSKKDAVDTSHDTSNDTDAVLSAASKKVGALPNANAGENGPADPTRPPTASGKGPPADPTRPPTASGRGPPADPTRPPTATGRGPPADPTRPPTAGGRGPPPDLTRPPTASGKGLPADPTRPPTASGKGLKVASASALSVSQTPSEKAAAAATRVSESASELRWKEKTIATADGRIETCDFDKGNTPRRALKSLSEQSESSGASETRKASTGDGEKEKEKDKAERKKSKAADQDKDGKKDKSVRKSKSGRSVKGDKAKIDKADAVLKDTNPDKGADKFEDDKPSHRRILIAGIVVGILTILLGVYFFVGSAQAVDIKTMERQAEAWNSKSCINLLVVGRATTGKHELMQSLLGERTECVSTEQHASTTVCDFNVRETCFKVTIWTLPDIAVGEYWSPMRDKLGTLDLVMYTLRMDDFQLRPEDASHLHTLSKVFGDTFWRKGMLALTFANKVTYLDGKLQVRRGRVFLDNHRKHLKGKIHDVLVPAGISEKVFKGIPFVPTGDRSEPLLFDEDTEPWVNCLTKCAIVKMNGIDSRASGGVWRATKHHLELPPDSTVINCNLLQ